MKTNIAVVGYTKRKKKIKLIQETLSSLMKICILFTYVFYLLDNVSEICVDLQDKPSSKFCFKYIKCFQVDWWHPNPPLARKLIYRLNASKYVEMLHNYEKLQIILSTCMIDVIIVKSLLFFFFTDDGPYVSSDILYVTYMKTCYVC